LFLLADDVPELIVDYDILDKLKGRIALARKIDTEQHKVKKESHEKSWIRETAEAMELEIDSDILEWVLQLFSFVLHKTNFNAVNLGMNALQRVKLNHTRQRSGL
jgi:hypothetical protein